MARHERRDSLGRRIGRNWWREYNCDLFYCAREAWEQQAEDASYGYTTELAEYRQAHPMPTLKEFLVGNAGLHRGQVA